MKRTKVSRGTRTCGLWTTASGVVTDGGESMVEAMVEEVDQVNHSTTKMKRSKREGALAEPKVCESE